MMWVGRTLSNFIILLSCFNYVNGILLLMAILKLFANEFLYYIIRCILHHLLLYWLIIDEQHIVVLLYHFIIKYRRSCKILFLFWAAGRELTLSNSRRYKSN